MTKDNTILASSIYFIALKTLEQVYKNFVPEELLASISRIGGCCQEDILSVGREVLQLAKNFSKSYPNLNNLKKFNRFQYRDD